MNEKDLEKLYPQALEWVEFQENLICKKGIPLSPFQMEDARRVKVQHPEKVRIYQTDTVPFPFETALQQAIVEIGVLGNTVKSALFGYGIWLHSDFACNRYLLVSEMALLAQMEAMGGLEPFLRAYIKDCFVHGGGRCTMDQKAARIAETICFD